MTRNSRKLKQPRQLFRKGRRQLERAILLLAVTTGACAAAELTGQETLEQAARHVTLWQAGWAAAYGAGAAFYLHRADQHDDRDARYDARINAAKAVLALGDVLVNPPPHRREHARLEQGEGTDDEIRAALAGLAEQERLRAGWRARVAPLVVNASAGLAIGAHQGRPADGLRNFASGMLVTELRIRSEPRQASNYTNKQKASGNRWYWWSDGQQLGLIRTY